jgi:hypothetical protein
MVTGQKYVHPFFCSGSPYRLRMQSGVWADGGAESVREFFDRMRRRELHAEWVFGRPNKPQDWVEAKDEDSVKVNQAIHDYLTAQATTVPHKYESVHGKGDAKGAPPCHQPMCFKYDLRSNSARPIGSPGSDPPNSLLPGLGRPVLPPTSLFPVEIPSGHRNAHCLALFLDESMLFRFGEILGLEKKEVTREKANGVLLKALDPAALHIDPQGPSQPRERARRLQRAWTCLPGLVGATGEDGYFRPKVELALTKQVDLSDWVGVVFCIGPEVQTPAGNGK